MEHIHPHPPEGGDHHNEKQEKPTAPADIIYEQLTDEQRIQRGIADALNEGRAIDDATARRIATQLPTGHDSALYSLASSGALDERLERELLESVQDTPPERDSWIDALLDYADARGEDRSPRDGWATVTADDSEQAIEAARSAARRERRADRARLERYVALGLDPGDAEALIEFQHMWRQQRAEQAGAGTQPTEAEQLSEAVPLPGTDTHREPVPSGGVDATPGRAERLTSPEVGGRSHPRIYVRCLASYNNGILHGRWVDAARDVEELWADVQSMLDDSPMVDAEEFAIHDYEGFAGYWLDGRENLEFVSRLARGIARHGQAFAAYVDWIGSEDPELAHFDDHFEGTYASADVWAEEVAEELFEWSRHLAAIPEPLQSAVRLDLDDLALTLGQLRHVVEGDHGVHIFNPDV